MAILTVRRAVILVIALTVFAYLDQVKHHAYVFDQDKLHSIAKETLKKNHTTTSELIHDLVKRLDREYPGHIRVEEQWVFNTAAGAMGQFWLLHGSITEYLIIFGTPIGTEGHTGRYLADDYFIILKGEQWGYSQGQIEKEIWLPGEMHHMPRGEAKGYKIPEFGYALEYAHGWIPTMLPTGFADVLTSNLDFYLVFRTIALYAQSAVIELLQGKF